MASNQTKENAALGMKDFSEAKELFLFEIEH